MFPVRRLTLLVLPLLAVGCADQGAAPKKASSEPPPSLPPLVSATAPAPAAATLDAPPPADSSSEVHWTTPKSWVEVPPSSQMRRAQYRVPGPGGDGECAVFYFGPGQGGDAMSNARRWAGQFKRPDGSPALPDMKTTTLTAGSRSVLLVEVSGTYDGGMTMTAAPATPKPGYALLGAIVEGPDANWFFKFIGPEATVRAQRAAFEGMIRSLKSGA